VADIVAELLKAVRYRHFKILIVTEVASINYSISVKVMVLYYCTAVLETGEKEETEKSFLSYPGS
jgi:hypothetical protein